MVAMSNAITVVSVALLLCCCSYCESSSDAARNMASGLYDTIRKIAFPTSPNLTEGASGEDNRFILMMPGKVLNYQDYFPGEKYTKFVQDPDHDQRFEVVPPHVMEKWFDLADVVPSANPLNGQDTGRSLANIYRSIITETTIKNLDQQGEQVRALYNQALGYLNEVVQHPEDLSKNATRLSIYNEYKELYNERRLEMEDKIEKERQSRNYLDYELWFQRHYPSLLSRVESAYIRWLIFGQKELCDIYITYLDTGSSAKALEEARVVLRSAGVSSLDRTRTIYPVNFEPSDWYKYLLPPLKQPSRTELQEILGRIDTKIATIDGIISFYRGTNSTLDSYAAKLQRRKNSQTDKRNEHLDSYLYNELECTVKSMGINDSSLSNACNDMATSSKSLSEYMDSEADATSSVGDYLWQSDNKKAYIKSLEREKAELQQKRSLINAALGKVDPLVGSILNTDPVAIAAILDAKKEDNWQVFQFNSEDYKSSTDYKSSHSSISASARAGGWFWSAGYSYSRSRSKSTYATRMSQSSMKAKGKLLRIFIKRPWFKPEVFDDRNLKFLSNTEKGGKVYGSPGKHLTELDFMNAVKGDESNKIYRLPEYVTSFLLAREVELEFSKVDRNTFSETVSTFTRHSAHCSFLCFSASFSSTKSDYNSRSSVDRTANGMRISIPGTQLIGYYTQKLPKFPADQI